MNLYLKQLALGPMANFVYLLGDLDARECAVVDAAWDVPAILEAAEKDGCRLTRAIFTHNHQDHINGLSQLLETIDLPVHIHADDAHDLGDLKKKLNATTEGDSLSVGGLKIEFLHTPGHTPGSQCLLAQGRLITGDTLFIGGCGRVDLPGSEPKKMFESLRRLAKLPGDTIILPGHDYGNRPSRAMAEEIPENPYLSLTDRDVNAFLSAVGA